MEAHCPACPRQRGGVCIIGKMIGRQTPPEKGFTIHRLLNLCSHLQGPRPWLWVALAIYLRDSTGLVLYCWIAGFWVERHVLPHWQAATTSGIFLVWSGSAACRAAPTSHYYFWECSWLSELFYLVYTVYTCSKGNGSPHANFDCMEDVLPVRHGLATRDNNKELNSVIPVILNNLRPSNHIIMWKWLDIRRPPNIGWLQIPSSQEGK